MGIQDDWAIDYANKRVYRNANNNVYDVNDLYSWLMNTFDELVQMDDPVPMSAQTPVEYTMINEWFIDDESIKYLKNGAIKTSGYDGKIQVLKLDNITVDPVTTDIGKMVQDDVADAGILLAYEIDPDGADTGKWWIRATGIIADGSAMTIPTGSGAGQANGASETGEDLYANVYTLGTIADTPNPQIYTFQAGKALAEWSDKTNWDRGHVDVLIKVKEAGTEIDGAVITVFARQQGDLFDNYEIDLTNGGRNAVPLSTAPDLDNATAEYYLLVDAETVAFSTVGQIVTGGTSGATAEMVGYTDWGTEGFLTLRGIKGTFQDNETITGSTEGSATVNGTVGDTYVTYDAAAVQLTVGNICTGTSGAKRILRGIQDDTGSGKYVFQVNTTVTGSDRDPYYKDFQDDDTVTDEGTGSVTLNANSTTIISGWDDITIIFVNGTATHGGTTGTFIPGERVTWLTGQSGVLLKDTGSAVTLGKCTDTALNTKTITGDISGATCVASQDLQSAHTMQKAFEQQANKNYDVIVECGEIYEAGRTLAEVYEYFKFVCREDSAFKMYTVVSAVITILDGEEYIMAYTGYTPKKAAPLGTFAGGKYFGAQGIWLEGIASGQSYQFIDSDGAVQDPPVTAIMKIAALVSGDKVGVFLTSVGEINKSQYNSHDTLNAAGDTDFEIEENIAQDTPAAGKLRVVDDDGSITFKEQRYRYSSWSGKIFTLVTGATGSGTSGSSGKVLVDSAADFGGTDDVEVGDVIRNTTDGSVGYVVSIDSTTQLTTTLEDGTGNDWEVADNYDTNKLGFTYDDGDTAYVPLIDAKATGTSVEQSVLYLADRTVLIRVRMYGGAGNSILPFQTTGTFIEAGLTVSAIRTADGIVT